MPCQTACGRGARRGDQAQHEARDQERPFGDGEDEEERSMGPVRGSACVWWAPPTVARLGYRCGAHPARPPNLRGIFACPNHDDPVIRPDRTPDLWSPIVNDAWIADRMKKIEASGIRKAFEMAKGMTDPINLSIGIPDFDVAEPVKAAAIDAIKRGRNAYTITLGIPELRARLQAEVEDELGHSDRQTIVTSGTSGGLLLALCSVVNPGDEVIIFDPYFVMYNNLVALAGGTRVVVDTYPDSASTPARSPRR